MELAVSREIAAPAERVWWLLVDWNRQGAWMPFTTVRTEYDGTRRDDHDTAVGTRLTAVTGLGPLRVTDPMVVTEWDPPRRCVVRHEGRVLRGDGIFTVEPLGPDRCRLSWREQLTPPGPWLVRTVAVLAKPISRPFFALALRRFATLAEKSCRG